MPSGCQQCACSELSDPRYLKLDELIQRYREVPGALIPVLHEAQQIFGYLPEDVQVKVAEGLNLPLSEIFGVITFYSLFSTQPRGKFTISVCMGTACYVRGSADILKKLQDELAIGVEGTTDDGLFSLTITRCLGACGLSPVININEDVYGRLTPNGIPAILQKYRDRECPKN